MSDLLVRVERLAVGLTAVAAIVAALIPGGGLRAAAGVLGGALLGMVSYWAVKRGVTGIASAMLSQAQAAPGEGTGTAAGRRRAPRGLVMFVVRYALLALLAYVMIARLRLPPIWLLSGASIMAIAASMTLLRGSRS